MLHEKEESLMCPECGDEFGVQVCYFSARNMFNVHLFNNFHQNVHYFVQVMKQSYRMYKPDSSQQKFVFPQI